MNDENSFLKNAAKTVPGCPGNEACTNSKMFELFKQNNAKSRTYSLKNECARTFHSTCDNLTV